MLVWVYCVAGIVFLLILVAREPDTVPATGGRIALMLLPAAVALILMPSRTYGFWPHPFAAGTFAVIWALMSGLHPGRVWTAKGTRGRRLAFWSLWTAIAVGATIMLLEEENLRWLP